MNSPAAGAASKPALGQPIRFRRHPPNAKEQARRVAWGKKWGALVSAAVKQSMRGL